MIPDGRDIIKPEVFFMAGDDETRFISQVQPQPVDPEINFKELKNAVKKKAEVNFQFNSLGGPLDPDFTNQ
ncbi:MAG: hypothetical protein ACOY40_07990 [Bacillota bacterium]